MGVQSLWYAPTKPEFDAAVTKFLTEWDERVPAYATYFRRNWLERFHPETWASYARADDAPSGSGSAEGFHNRLSANMPRAALSLDKMVDFLAGEDEYWRRIVNDSRLWAEKKMKHEAAQERHRRKRRMLKHYVERGNNPERSGDSDIISISSDLFSGSENGDDDGDGSIDDTMEMKDAPPPPSSPPFPPRTLDIHGHPPQQ